MKSGLPPYRHAAESSRRLLETQMLATVRDARFAGGLECPRCRGTRVQRWGTFSGRQRYRCRACGRTFSDLTGTPMAYSKRLAAWPAYLVRMQLGTTLRDASSAVGIHLSTSFRWRHAILAGLRHRESLRVAGWIELADVEFAYSSKGAREIETPRRSGARDNLWLWLEAPRVHVGLLRNRSGDMIAMTFDQGTPNVPQMNEYFGRDVAPGATVVCRPRTAHWYGNAARRAGHRLIEIRRDVADPLQHTDNVDAYAWRLYDWLLRFRGVATRYLPNYLAWHRALDVQAHRWWVQRCAGRSARRPDDNDSSSQQFHRTQVHSTGRRRSPGPGP